jgi:thioredoxin-dependent peroxiredoxin
MKLQEGQPAIDFSAEDIYGNKIQLSDYKGKKIILGFHRHMSCPFCNRRVHQLMGRNLRLQKSGAQIILLFESSNEKLKDSVFHKGIQPWPLIGDPNREIYNIYGVERSTGKMMKTMFATNAFKAMRDTKDLNLPKFSGGTLNLIPADFFIDEDFNIVKAHYGSHADDHVEMSLLEDFAGIRR